MTSDAKIEAYIKQTAPEGISDDDLNNFLNDLLNVRNLFKTLA